MGIFEELPTLAANNQRAKFEEALEEFEAERLVVLEATEESNAQMSDRDCRCQRCGQLGTAVDRCKDCGLTMLHPDPKQLQDYSLTSARLSLSHVRLYNALVSVKEGKSSLEALMATLPTLTAQVRELTRFCDHADEEELPPWLLSSLRRNIQAAQGGIERLAGTATSRRISDLNRGWEDIFESSVVGPRIVPAVARIVRRSLARPPELREDASPPIRQGDLRACALSGTCLLQP